QRRNWQLEIIDRTRRRREMKNVIKFFFRQENKIGNVVLDELEIGIAGKMSNVRRVAGYQIVDRNDAMAFGQESIDQVRSQEACAASHHRNRFRFFLRHSTGYLIPK